MKLYRTAETVIVEHEATFYPVPATTWDDLLCDPAILDKARAATAGTPSRSIPPQPSPPS